MLNFCKDLTSVFKKKKKLDFREKVGDVEILSLIKILTVNRWRTNSGHAMCPDKFPGKVWPFVDVLVLAQLESQQSAT